MILILEPTAINNDWLDNFIPWLGKQQKLPQKGYCWLNPFLYSAGTKITYFPEKALILVRASKTFFVPAKPALPGKDLKIIYKAVGISTIDFSNSAKHINVYSGRWFDKTNIASLDDDILYSNNKASSSVIK